MSSTGTTIEKIETNKVKLTIKIDPSEFERGLQHAYNRNKQHITIQGFRKGKAPRKIIERYYGKDVFYEEAVNHVLPDAYERTVDEHNIEPVYRPEINVESMDAAEGAVLVAEVYIKPEVTIEGYHGLTYPIVETEPTEEDIENRMQAEREKNARIVTVDRASQMGDTVTINFTGYIDDKPFEGGHAEEYELTLGSKNFIDTFEEQLVGKSVGDDVDVNVTFPDDYSKEELRGKPALFKVEILEVRAREMPELNDEFAQDVSEFDTLEELREDLMNKLREEKEQQALFEKRTNLVQQLVEKAEMEIPEVMYTARVEELIEELRYRLWQRGLNLEQYLAFSHMTMDSLKENYGPSAKEEVEGGLVLEAIAKNEKFEISDEELLEHIKQIAPSGQDPEKLIEDMSDDRKKSFIQDLLKQKALDFVVENAVAMETL